MIYMDNAATSWPKPHCVYEAIVNCMKSAGANPGRSSHLMSIDAGNIILRTRELLAKFFNTDDPFRIIFTSNTTEALNLGIKGLLRKGDHVITTTMEHNSVVRPLKTLEQRGINTTFVKCNSQGILDPHDVESAIEKNTKLVITTHASNVTGGIMPIDEIGKITNRYGIVYMVDAAQTAGIIPIDVKKSSIDMLAFPGHKSLLGPQGTGGLYISPNLDIEPLKEGGTGSLSESYYQPNFLPDRYESGTLNTPGIAGLGAGVEFLLKHEDMYVLNKIRKLETYFLDGLSNIDEVKVYGPTDIEHRIGVIALNICHRDSAEVVSLLSDVYNISTRGELHCAPLAHATIGTSEFGAVRFSPGLFSSLEDIDACIDALSKIARQ